MLAGAGTREDSRIEAQELRDHPGALGRLAQQLYWSPWQHETKRWKYLGQGVFRGSACVALRRNLTVWP